MNYLAHETINAIASAIPQVQKPTKRLTFNAKLGWTFLILLTYFCLTEVEIYGIPTGQADIFGRLRIIMAGSAGSILTLGIGPIVMSGIVMQLLVGADIIHLDMSNPLDKATFQSTQKILTIFMCLFEAIMWAMRYGGMSTLQFILVVFQLAMGGMLVMFLDEVVSKWGIGSGISLFIAAGVSQAIVWQAFSPVHDEYYTTQIVGAIPDFIVDLIQGKPELMREGALPDMMGVFATIMVFLIVVFAECMRIEIPLSYGKVKGLRGRYPIRFIYSSNIPVILASALFANIVLMSGVFKKFGLGFLGHMDDSGEPHGFLKYITPLRSPGEVVDEPFRALIYLIIMVVICVLFAIMWIDLTNMNAAAIAKQLHSQGMHIPGFRSDQRVMEKVLNRYIPYVTIMSGAFVGLLATLADFTGALGTGTGILLTVGILYRLYEEIAREQAAEMFPGFGSIFG